MHIGQEEESAGRQAGERMKAMGVKQALILNQEVGNVALDQRTKGFWTVLKVLSIMSRYFR
jgi:simple sugar transport system substrate-binding protein